MCLAVVHQRVLGLDEGLERVVSVDDLGFANSPMVDPASASL
jgi:hypothetical protein